LFAHEGFEEGVKKLIGDRNGGGEWCKRSAANGGAAFLTMLLPVFWYLWGRAGRRRVVSLQTSVPSSAKGRERTSWRGRFGDSEARKRYGCPPTQLSILPHPNPTLPTTNTFLVFWSEDVCTTADNEG